MLAMTEQVAVVASGSTVRACSVCRLVLPVDQFVKGKPSRCRRCHGAEQKRRYQASDKTVEVAKRQAWADANRPKRRQIAAAYERRRRQLDPAGAVCRDRRGNSARHARECEAEQRQVTAGDLRRLAHRQMHRCAYCDERRALTVDHVVPLARGGRHAIGNIVLACQPCNSSKRARFLIEWRTSR